MPNTERKCWLTFEGGCQDQPCVWQMSQKFPDVPFDIRQAKVGKDIGIIALKLTGENDRIDAAIEYLESLGVKVDPVEGGSLVEP